MTPNDTMQAIRFHDYGGPEQLVFDRVPRPELQPQTVLVRVHAAGVNPFDWKVRSGAMKQFMPVPLPYVPGIDLAGVIEALGPGVTGWKKGESVYGTTQGGAYAEFAVVPVGTLAPKPASLSFNDAAGVPVGALTAWRAVFDSADVQPGQRVFVQGGAGGVGSFVVQLARWKGAKVTATASSRNLEYVHSLGAEVVIDHQGAPFETIARDMDVVIDTVGGGVQERVWQVLKPGGILVAVAGRPSEDAAKAHGVRATAVSRGDQSANGDLLRQIGDLIAQGKVKAQVFNVYPLAEAAKAHAHSETGHGRGRIVLHVAD